MSWLFSWFRRSVEANGDASGDSRSVAQVVTALEASLQEGVQKLARLQARHGARLEEIENKVEGGFADLRSATEHAARAASAPVRWDDLLDAADALDEAERSAIAAGDQPMADGLRAVVTRVGRFLAQQGVRREGRVGVPPDPALVRVIGAVEAPAMNEGHVARVVRAAAMEGGRLLREGEVLVARRPPPPPNAEANP
ncbi:MAG TPA: nucleotide exchange factor GrpE [Solirubrobacteraceae bacterium]|nr:nucleotide exchange factor GrpE [Solirubrobacteraceae bacterium]